MGLLQGYTHIHSGTASRVYTHTQWDCFKGIHTHTVGLLQGYTHTHSGTASRVYTHTQWDCSKGIHTHTVGLLQGYTHTHSGTASRVYTHTHSGTAPNVYSCLKASSSVCTLHTAITRVILVLEQNMRFGCAWMHCLSNHLLYNVYIICDLHVSHIHGHMSHVTCFVYLCHMYVTCSQSHVTCV